nr:ABC transporter ATP-binding protein [Vagococcus salmoninarum]
MLKDVSFSIKKGEFVSIVGASGSGKSTIFRLIAGLEEQSSGTISLNGEKTEKRLGKVGYMPQQDLLMPWRTIRQNAALPLELQKKTNTDNEKVDKLLEDFGLKGYENKYPNELSGGMRQRVSFLRATLSGSNVLLLDEPFSALDAMTRLHMQEWLLQQWEKQGATILFITHDISEALFLSDRILMITETPFTTMEEAEVPLQRPRQQHHLDQQAVVELKNNLIERFRMRG